MLLICSAWKNEIAKLEGNIQNEQIAIQELGIGYLEAALKLQKLIYHYQELQKPIKQIIFLGTAGAYGSVNIGDIARVNSVSLIHQAKLSALTYLPENLAKEIYFVPKDNGSIANLAEMGSLPQAHCFSSLEITRDKAIYEKLSKNDLPEDIQTMPLVENMELFGIAKVANQAQIPWSSLLAISNHIHQDAHQEWSANHQDCSDKLCDFIAQGL